MAIKIDALIEKNSNPEGFYTLMTLWTIGMVCASGLGRCT